MRRPIRRREAGDSRRYVAVDAGDVMAVCNDQRSLLLFTAPAATAPAPAGGTSDVPLPPARATPAPARRSAWETLGGGQA